MDNTVDCAYTGRRSYDTTNSKIVEDSSIQQHQQQFDQHSNPNPTTPPPFFFTWSLQNTPPSQNKWRYSIHADQTFSSLTTFIENITTFVSLNKFIIKIDSTIYLLIPTMYYKNINIFLYIWSNLKTFDFSGSKNNIYFWDGVVSWIPNIAAPFSFTWLMCCFLYLFMFFYGI
jgi:hypothetical protein